jgi:hypothetical protein
MFLAASSGASAQSSGTALERSHRSLKPQEDLIPSALEVYSSSEALTSGAFSDLTSIVSTGRPESLARASVPTYQTASLDESGGDSGGGRYLPALFSALVPGTGEIYLGYTWRGVALIALDVASWAGYIHYRNEGLDTREAYESFADTHWNIDKWMDDHALLWPSENLDTPAQMDSMGMVHSGSGEWPGYMPWVSKEEDKQHFYENVGKYDWFISGWADYDPSVDPFMTDTELRDQYREMRKESNDQLETADNFIYISLGLRVFSVVETLFLARSSGAETDTGGSADDSQNQLRFHARAKGFDGGEVYLQYSFK